MLWPGLFLVTVGAAFVWFGYLRYTHPDYLQPFADRWARRVSDRQRHLTARWTGAGMVALGVWLFFLGVFGVVKSV